MKTLLLLLITLLFTGCMDLKDVNAGLWYSARSVNTAYVELLSDEDGKEHLEYLDNDMDAYFQEKYGETIFANASVCADSLSDLSSTQLKRLVATDIEKSTPACNTTFSNSNLGACISFNYYFAEHVARNCSNGQALAEKHILNWESGKFYCTEKYNNSITHEDSFPPREVCMKKILNIDCEEIENEYIGENIEDKLDCYVDGVDR